MTGATKSQTVMEQTPTITVISFGYKAGLPPAANITFDVRFLKNPYWVEELRPQCGLDKPVQDYVMQFEPAQQFLQSVLTMMKDLVPRLCEWGINEYSIAFGCTGGQHRSATMVEMLITALKQAHPQLKIRRHHRELELQNHPELVQARTTEIKSS